MDKLKEITVKNILLPFVKIIHLSIILFVILSPFSNAPGFLVLNSTLTMSLITHWISSSDICCLSLLESYFSGKPYKNTFIHSLVSPVYNLPESVLSKIAWGITIGSFVVSISKLFKTFFIDKKNITMKNIFSLVKI